MSGPVAALAATEGRRLVRNPIVWLSLAPTAVWVRAAVRGGDRDGESRLFLLTGYGLAFTGFVLVAATVMATLRSRIEGSDELLTTVAVGPDRRTLGHAGSTLALGAVGVAVTIALLAVLRPSDPLGTWDPTETGDAIELPRPNAAQLLQGPLAIIAVATFAIAVVRWIPSWLVLAPLLFLLMVQMSFLGLFHGVVADGGRWFAPLSTGIVNGPWTGCGSDDATCRLAVDGYDRTTPWWHAAYLVAASCWFTSIAVLRHRRDRLAWRWFTVALVVLVIVVAIQFSVAEEYVPS